MLMQFHLLACRLCTARERTSISTLYDWHVHVRPQLLFPSHLHVSLHHSQYDVHSLQVS